jgi:hypothetical protein
VNKPLLGVIVGALLGVFDGLSALVSAPEVAPEIALIVVGSTVKGLVVGLAAGFFARKVRSVPLGIAFGLVLGLLFAYWVASQPDALTKRHYYLEIMLPGSLAGAIVGYATQKFGRGPAPASARGRCGFARRPAPRLTLRRASHRVTPWSPLDPTG